MGNDKATESLDKTKEVLDSDLSTKPFDTAKQEKIYTVITEMYKQFITNPSTDTTEAMEWVRKTASIVQNIDILERRYGRAEMKKVDYSLMINPVLMNDLKQIGVDVSDASAYRIIYMELLRKMTMLVSDKYNNAVLSGNINNNTVPIAVDIINPFNAMNHVANIYSDLSGRPPFVDINSAYGLIISMALLLRLAIKSLNWEKTNPNFKQNVQGISSSIIMSAIHNGNAVVKQFFESSRRYSDDTIYFSMQYLYNLVTEEAAMQLQNTGELTDIEYAFVQKCEEFIMKTNPSTRKWNYPMAITALQLIKGGQDAMHLKTLRTDFISVDNDEQLIENGIYLIEQTFAENSHGYCYHNEDVHKLFKRLI